MASALVIEKHPSHLPVRYRTWEELRTRHCGRFVALRTQVCRLYTYRHDLCVRDEFRGTTSSPVAKVVVVIIGQPAWIVQIVQKDAGVPVAEAAVRGVTRRIRGFLPLPGPARR